MPSIHKFKDKMETQYTEKVNGKDTTRTCTVDGTKYPFAIDQVTRHIYNVYSLPVGTDISKVVVSIKSDGIGTVSYTHLDVYKRQPHLRIHHIIIHRIKSQQAGGHLTICLLYTSRCV